MKFVSALAFAFAAYYAARGLGLPAWRDWEAGDAADIGMLVFLGVLFWRCK